MLRICARPITKESEANTTTPGEVVVPPDEVYNFSFISSTNAIGDREEFKREISQAIAQNRAPKVPETPEIVPAPAPSLDPQPLSSTNPVDKGKAIDPLEDWRLKKRVLQNNHDLRQLHREMVMGGQISEGEFWDGREELLYHEARLDSQKKGRSAQMVDPRPETTDSGEITISVTPQLIHDIFEQYPVVQKAYAENVPPVSSLP